MMLPKSRLILLVLCIMLNVAVFAQEQQQKQENAVMVFISFSMPKQSIIAYLQDAQKIHASVFIRGLVNNSFKETFKIISQLVTEAGGGGIALDPLAFKAFNIHQAPSIVVLGGDHSCLQQRNCTLEKDYDLLVGNITLQAALNEIRNHGKVANKTAEYLLLQLNGGTHV